MVVETDRADYNISPYKHLGAKDVLIQHPLTLGVRIKTGMGTAKTPCYKTSIFSAETAKGRLDSATSFSMPPVFQLSWDTRNFCKFCFFPVKSGFLQD